MNLKGILLITLNLVTISLSDSKQNAISQVEPASEIFTSYEEQCPLLLKIIRDNNVANYTISCPYTMVNVKKISEKVALDYACSLSGKIVQYICANKISITKEYLSLDVVEKIDSICPMDFTQLRKLVSCEPHAIEQKLTTKKSCVQVCDDLDEPKSQCVVLSKLNNFINNGSTVGGKTEGEAKEVIMTESRGTSAKSEVTKDTFNEKKKIENENENDDDKVFEMLKTENSVTVKSDKPVEIKETKPAKIENIFTDEETRKVAPVENEGKTELSKPMENTSQLDMKTTDFGFSTSSKSILLDSKELKTPRKDQNEENLDEDDDLDDTNQEMGTLEEEPKMLKHKRLPPNEVYSGEGFFQAEDSHFFFYFLMFSTVIVIGYLVFHNKNKILAYALEGSSGRRNRRRPNPARYRKLESNLEEAMSANSSQSAASTVVY